MMILVISYPAAAFWKNCELWCKSKKAHHNKTAVHSGTRTCMITAHSLSLSPMSIDLSQMIPLSFRNEFYVNNYFFSASFVCCWLIMQSLALSVIPHCFVPGLHQSNTTEKECCHNIDNTYYITRDRHNDLTHRTRWGCGSTDIVMSH